MIYLQLFYNFFITGLFSIGGGLATLPFLYDLSDKTGWFTHAELANMLGRIESTPGEPSVSIWRHLCGLRQRLCPAPSSPRWD